MFSIFIQEKFYDELDDFQRNAPLLDDTVLILWVFAGRLDASGGISPCCPEVQPPIYP